MSWSGERDTADDSKSQKNHIFLVNGRHCGPVVEVLRGTSRGSHPNLIKELAYMKKLLAILVAGLFAAGAFAQGAAPAAPATPAVTSAPSAEPAAPAPKAHAKAKSKKPAAHKVAHKKATKKHAKSAA
ncbi:hypothetical protein AVHM3334_04005 [Acidovorax sp. SUPP3334]|nr:hypothetical protein AVHM3334_04005 [Acidovorax sp. SUPP3334]